MAKKNERDNRRAIAEQMRKEQARKERRRSLLILGACVAGGPRAARHRRLRLRQGPARGEQGSGHPPRRARGHESAAGCDPVKTEDATGSGDHIDPPTKIPYPQAPPAFGPHWPNFLQGSEIRTFYTAEDRPEIERLVHSLEHGHTILWYDETVKPGTDAYKDVQAIAEKFDEERQVHRSPLEESRRRPSPAASTSR